MATQNVIVYGEGGQLPDKPNDNIVEQYQEEIPDPVLTIPEKVAQVLLDAPEISAETKAKLIEALGT